jgi:hypothetical protein
VGFRPAASNRSRHGAESRPTGLETPHGRPTQDAGFGGGRSRATRSGLHRYWIEDAAVPHAIEGIASGDRGRRLGRRMAAGSQGRYGELRRITVAGGEDNAE